MLSQSPGFVYSNVPPLASSAVGGDRPVQNKSGDRWLVRLTGNEAKNNPQPT